MNTSDQLNDNNIKMSLHHTQTERDEITLHSQHLLP